MHAAYFVSWVRTQALADSWVDALQLPDWWRPSHLRDAFLRASVSSNMVLYLSLASGLLLSIVLFCVNRSLQSRYVTKQEASTGRKQTKAD